MAGRDDDARRPEGAVARDVSQQLIVALSASLIDVNDAS